MFNHNTMRLFRYKCCPNDDVSSSFSDFSYLWLPGEYCKNIKIDFSGLERPADDIIRAMMKVTEEAAKTEYSNYTVNVVKCDINQTGSNMDLDFLLCLVPHDILVKLKDSTIKRLTVVFLKTKNVSYKFRNQMPDDSAIYSSDTIIDFTLS